MQFVDLCCRTRGGGGLELSIEEAKSWIIFGFVGEVRISRKTHGVRMGIYDV